MPHGHSGDTEEMQMPIQEMGPAWVPGDSITGGWWTTKSRQFLLHHGVQFCQSPGLSSMTLPLHCPVAARGWWAGSAYNPLHTASMGEKAERSLLVHLWKLELRLLTKSSGSLLPLTPLTSPLDSKQKSQGRPSPAGWDHSRTFRKVYEDG